MKTWFHLECFFQIKKTKNSKTINSIDEIDGWDLLSNDDQNIVLGKLDPSVKINQSVRSLCSKPDSKDNLFSEFQRIVSKIANEPSYNSKSQILGKFLREVSFL